MTATTAAGPPRSYWIISALAFVWMLIGVGAWVADLMMSEAALAEMTEGQRQLYASRPQWLFIVYAVAIFSGLAGAVGLLLRKAWVVPAFAISLAAVTVQFGYTFLVMDAIRHIGAAAAIPLPASIFAIGAALLWYSMMASKRGWLGESGAKAASGRPSATP